MFSGWNRCWTSTTVSSSRPATRLGKIDCWGKRITSAPDRRKASSTARARQGLKASSSRSTTIRRPLRATMARSQPGVSRLAASPSSSTATRESPASATRGSSARSFRT